MDDLGAGGNLPRTMRHARGIFGIVKDVVTTASVIQQIVFAAMVVTICGTICFVVWKEYDDRKYRYASDSVRRDVLDILAVTKRTAERLDDLSEEIRKIKSQLAAAEARTQVVDNRVVTVAWDVAAAEPKAAPPGAATLIAEAYRAEVQFLTGQYRLDQVYKAVPIDKEVTELVQRLRARYSPDALAIDMVLEGGADAVGSNRALTVPYRGDFGATLVIGNATVDGQTMPDVRLVEGEMLKGNAELALLRAYSLGHAFRQASERVIGAIKEQITYRATVSAQEGRQHRYGRITVRFRVLDPGRLLRERHSV